MGNTTVYLLPEGPSIDPRAYRLRVKKVLQRFGVIGNERYDGEPNWYVAGPNSNQPFAALADHEIGFEYCIIYGSVNVEVVPQDPAVQPHCPSCDADLSQPYYDLINDIEMTYSGRAKSRKHLSSRISCTKCTHASSLPELKDSVGVFLSGTWVNFEDIQSELRPEWLTEFNMQTGWQHRALTYWYT
jgi:hypothetical protein